MNVKTGDVLEADLDKENDKLKFSFKTGRRKIKGIKKNIQLYKAILTDGFFFLPGDFCPKSVVLEKSFQTF